MGYNPFQSIGQAQQGTPQQLQNAYNNHLSQSAATQQAMNAFNQLAQIGRAHV